MSEKLINLATEVADSREAELPHKLLKLRGRLLRMILKLLLVDIKF